MILKLIAPLIIFIILIIEKLFPERLIGTKKIQRVFFGLLILSLIFNIAVIKYDDSQTTERFKNQTDQQNLLIQKNDSLKTQLDSLLVLVRDFESNSDNRSIVQNSKIDELTLQIEPFIKLAVKKYPDIKIADALEKIQTELAETKILAQPNSIKYQKKEIKKIDNGYSVKLFFTPAKNEPLGLIKIAVRVIGENSTKIYDIWPTLDGGAYATDSEKSKLIIQSGKEAIIIYNLLGTGRPVIEVKVSSKCKLFIRGNLGLEEFYIEI